MQFIKNLFKQIAIVVVSIYTLGVMIAVPYFNWKYAQQNGFISWIFFGELVATFKGFFFPYFIYNEYYVTQNTQNYPSFPSKYLKDRENFTKVIQLFDEARKLTSKENSKSSEWYGAYSVSKEDEDLSANKMKEGIELSKNISDDFFNYLNPDFKDNFRNKLIKGHELIVSKENENTESKKIKVQLDGISLIQDYYKWWDLNKDSITDKAFAN